MPRPASLASVVVAAHNDSEGLVTTVESAVRCSRARPLEVVAVNDCSTDDTWRRLVEIKERHPEVHLVDFGERYGDAVAMLEGARRATGASVCFAAPGADPGVLRSILDASSRPRPDVIAELEADPATRLEGHALAQAFPPGITIGGEVGLPEPAPDRGVDRSSRRRRLVLGLALGTVALGVAIPLALALTGRTIDQAAETAPAAAGAVPEPAAESPQDDAEAAPASEDVEIATATGDVPDGPAETGSAGSSQGGLILAAAPADAPADAPSEQRSAPPVPDSDPSAPGGAPVTDAPGSGHETGGDPVPEVPATPSSTPAPSAGGGGPAPPPDDASGGSREPPNDESPSPSPSPPPSDPAPTTDPPATPAGPPYGNGNGNGQANGHGNGNGGNGHGNGNGKGQGNGDG